MIFQNDLYSSYYIVIVLFVVVICLSITIARIIQDRQRRRTAQFLQQVRNNSDEPYPDIDVTPERRSIVRKRPQKDDVLHKWEEILLTTRDPREKMNAIAQLGQYGNKYTLDMLIEYIEVDQNPKILAVIDDAMIKIENRLTRPSNEPDDDQVTFYS